MNFKNIKKIIVVCLIMLLFSNKISNKMYENFKLTTTQALDTVKIIEKKVNDMFYKVDANWNNSNQGIYSKKGIEAESDIRSRKGNVAANLDVNAGRNLNARSHVKAGGNMSADGNMSAIGNVKGKKICIGSTCIDENVLKRLNVKTKPPTKSGCWMYTASDCENDEARRRGNEIKGEWFFDSVNGAATSDSKCKKRVKDYNSWCKSDDFRHHWNKGY